MVDRMHRMMVLIIFMLAVTWSCSNHKDWELEETANNKISATRLRVNLIALKEVAAQRGIYQLAPIAGIANAETGLAHCWSDATWTCQGPNSNSCGGGPIVAGAGDGPCYDREGGLGLFQLDGGTYNQTINREGQAVLSLEGNITAGIRFIINMLKQEKGFSADQKAIDWINGIEIGSSRYFEWIDIIVERYNGCIRGRCSAFTQRWYHYDGKTRAVLDDVARLPTLTEQKWIGSICQTDQDCAFSTEDSVARCVGNSMSGICVTSCEGYCPDRSGYPSTFCAEASQINLGSGGLCLARANERNNDCAHGQKQLVKRFIGGSNASDRFVEVCLPPQSQYSSTEQLDHQEVTDHSTEENSPINDQEGLLCGDISLPRANTLCAEIEEGRWRCACHESYLEPVSQVCRGGTWINYRLNPNHCTQCQGGYSQACE